MALFFISSEGRTAEERSFAFDPPLYSEKIFYFDLPQQPLGQALIAFAKQAGLDILFESYEVEGEKPLSTPLIGHMSVEQALSALLSFSALEYAYTDPNTVVIRKKQLIAKQGKPNFIFRLPEVSVVEKEWPQEAFLQQPMETGTAKETTLFDGSISGSTISASRIGKLSARSTGEIIRSLPGILSESSGGVGNANITLRGIPLATGGSKFLQLHEDGLPILEFGDIVGGNPDNYLRYDNTVMRVESVRGGSASTFASNSPGGIVNFISRTGEEAGGSVEYIQGLDYDSSRLNFEFGTPLTDSRRFHIGGYLRSGEGPREVGFSGERGVQIKGNITHEFDTGYLRFYGKHLDDTGISQLSSAVRVEGNGSYGSVGGYDAAHSGIQSPFNLGLNTLNADGSPVFLSFNESFDVDVTALGVRFETELGNDFTLSYKGRASQINSRVILPLAIGIEENASNLGDSVTIAAGPGAGTAYNGLAQLNLWLDFISDSLDYTVQDFQISQQQDNLTWTVGLYNSNQSIQQSWPAWSIQWVALGNGAARPLEIVTAGIDTTDNGITTRNVFSEILDLEYDTFAPYANIQLDFDRLILDISYRRDRAEARGARFDVSSSPVVDIDGDGAISIVESGGTRAPIDIGSPELMNFDVSYDSYSAGGNFMVSNSLAVFARFAKGGRVIADRVFDVGILDPTAGVSIGSPVDENKQVEVGVKLQGERFSVFTAWFNSKTDETQFEITSRTRFSRQYEANGIEVESDFSIGDNFYFNGNLTWINAEIVTDNLSPALVGNTPRRQADLIYTITPEYRNSIFSAGMIFQGSSAYYLQDINELKQKGYMIINAFFGWNIDDQLSLTVNINNMTDEFVLTEAEDGDFASAADGTIRGRPLAGRSATAALKYRF